VDDCRNYEGQQLSDCPSFPKSREETVNVQIDVVVKPIMNYYVPLAVIGTKLDGIPPV